MKHKEAKKFVESQKLQLGLDDAEASLLFEQATEMDDYGDDSETFELESEESEESEDFDFEFDPELKKETVESGVFDCHLDLNMESDDVLFGMPSPAEKTKSARRASPEKKNSSFKSGSKRKKVRRKAMSDPYLSESQTVKARPSRISKIRSLFFEHAMPNEYIMQIGVEDAKPVLGRKFFKIGKRFLKFPATVQTVYFTSDNANRNYQGLRIDGYACWRIDPEKPEVAARTLDFSDQENPMGNTNRILRTICTEAIRHIIANITLEDALTKKDEIGRDLKAQLERTERSWGITFDQVGIERVTILSSKVFSDLQQKTRDVLRLDASESRMETDQKIEKKKAGYTEDSEELRCHTEKKTRILKATSETEIRKVELDEKVRRETEKRNALEVMKSEENEAAERAAEQEAERLKRQAVRDAEVEAHKESEQRKLEMARMSSEAEIRTSKAEIEARVAEAQARSEMARSEAEHEKELKKQELEAGRNFQAMEDEQRLKSARLTAELRMGAERSERVMKEQRNQAELKHEVAMNRLEELKLEEDLRNLISENRVMAAFVDKLPEIASSLKIDRHTVLDTSGGSPLTYSLAQILTVLDEHGLRRFFEGKKEEAD